MSRFISAIVLSAVVLCLSYGPARADDGVVFSIVGIYENKQNGSIEAEMKPYPFLVELEGLHKIISGKLDKLNIPSRPYAALKEVMSKFDQADQQTVGIFLYDIFKVMNAALLDQPVPPEPEITEFPSVLKYQADSEQWPEAQPIIVLVGYETVNAQGHVIGLMAAVHLDVYGQVRGMMTSAYDTYTLDEDQYIDIVVKLVNGLI